MNIKAKNGYGLLMVIFFIIVVLSVISGSFMFVEHLAKETRLHEVEYIRGYYAAMAGLRYAYILLEDPVVNCNFTLGHGDRESYTVTGLELGGDFFTDIHVDLAHLTITITERGLLPPLVDPQYEVSATYDRF